MNADYWDCTNADYWACTDCGAHTRALGEVAYQVRPTVWEAAYPGYRDGTGVGSSRPCIGCLEARLGRPLTRRDFTRATGSINEPDRARHGQRLMSRLTQTAAGLIWDELDQQDPLPSIDELCQAIGIRPQHTRPGDQFAGEVDVAMYWPQVRPCWEGGGG